MEDVFGPDTDSYEDIPPKHILIWADAFSKKMHISTATKNTYPVTIHSFYSSSYTCNNIFKVIIKRLYKYDNGIDIVYSFHLQLVVAMTYLIRALEKLKMPMNTFNMNIIIKMFISCVIITVKYMSDWRPRMDLYSRIFGLNIQDIIHSELDMLNILDWNIEVSLSQLVKTLSFMSSQMGDST